MDRFKVIGLAGKAGVGKTTAGRLLAGRYNLVGMEFAGPIKAMIGSMLSPVVCYWEERAWKESPLVELGLDVSPRRLAQTLGTEWGRELVQPDLWVRLMASRVALARELAGDETKLIRPRGVVIGDCRFPNEVEYVRSEGGLVIRLEGPVRGGLGEGAERHASEAGVTADAVVDNRGNLEDLVRMLAEVVDEHYGRANA